MNQLSWFKSNWKSSFFNQKFKLEKSPQFDFIYYPRRDKLPTTTSVQYRNSSTCNGMKRKPVPVGFWQLFSEHKPLQTHLIFIKFAIISVREVVKKTPQIFYGLADRKGGGGGGVNPRCPDRSICEKINTFFPMEYDSLIIKTHFT